MGEGKHWKKVEDMEKILTFYGSAAFKNGKKQQTFVFLLSLHAAAAAAATPDFKFHACLQETL